MQQFPRFLLIPQFGWEIRRFLKFGSDTGSRGSSPLNFTEKTGISLTFSQVQLTIRQSAQNFEHLFFCTNEGEIQPSFSGIFWDKLGQIRQIMILTGTESLKSLP